MTDIKKNGNNKEQKSQGKKPPKSSKLLELLKQQPDQVDNRKKIIEKISKDDLSNLGEKIKKVPKDHPCHNNKYSRSIRTIESMCQRQASLTKVDYQQFDELVKILWTELEKPCAYLYIYISRIKPLPIYLEIKKKPHKYLYLELLVKCINNHEKMIEEKLEIKHEIMYHTLSIPRLYLNDSITIPESAIFGNVKDRVIYPFDIMITRKILYNLNTFTYCKLIERINRNISSSNKNLKDLKKLKKIAEDWFSGNKYNIPGDTERFRSLDLLQELFKTSEAVKDERTAESEKKDMPVSEIVKVIKDAGLNKSEKRLPQFKRRPINDWECLRLKYSQNELNKVSLNSKKYTAEELGFNAKRKGDECVHFSELITIIEYINKNNEGTIRPGTLDQIKQSLKNSKIKKRLSTVNKILKGKIGLNTNPITTTNGFYQTDIKLTIIEYGNHFRQSKFSTKKSDKEAYNNFITEKNSTADEPYTPRGEYDKGGTRDYFDKTDEPDIEYDDYSDGSIEEH